MVAIESERKIEQTQEENFTQEAQNLFRVGKLYVGYGEQMFTVETGVCIEVRNRKRNNKIVPITEVDYLIRCYKDEYTADERKRIYLGGSVGASKVGAFTSLEKKFGEPLTEQLRSLFSR